MPPHVHLVPSTIYISGYIYIPPYIYIYIYMIYDIYIYIYICVCVCVCVCCYSTAFSVVSSQSQCGQ